MSDPNLPEGVTQKDIDGTCGETFDPDLCQHHDIVCQNCGRSMEETLHGEKEKRLAEWNDGLSILLRAELDAVKLRAIEMEAWIVKLRKGFES